MYMSMVRSEHQGRSAFSIVELLVAIACISALMALLFPALTQARRHADQVRCASQLRQVGIVLQGYQNGNRGWLYPVTVHPTTGEPHGLGTNRPPHLRWPMLAFDMPGAPNPPPYDPAAYNRLVYDPVQFPPEPYTPAVLRCPSDLDPMEGHSYFLNGLLILRRVRAGSGLPSDRSSSDVMLMGEKYSDQGDLFLQGEREYQRMVDPYRHGLRYFSNYLFLDGHVAAVPPKDARVGLDPWGDVLPPEVAPSVE
jgi:prepilin-type processing-associated H-X9-DG protein